MDGTRDDHTPAEDSPEWQWMLRTFIDRLSTDGPKLLAATVAAGFLLVATFGASTLGNNHESLSVLKELVFVTLQEVTFLFSASLVVLAASFALPPSRPGRMKRIGHSGVDLVRVLVAALVATAFVLVVITLGAFNRNFAAYTGSLPIEPTSYSITQCRLAARKTGGAALCDDMRWSPADAVSRAAIRCYLNSKRPEGAALCAEAAVTAAERAKALAEAARRTGG